MSIEKLVCNPRGCVVSQEKVRGTFDNKEENGVEKNKNYFCEFASFRTCFHV